MTANGPRLVFLEDPGPEAIDQITGLYRAEGWWGEGPGDPAHVAAIVAGSHCFVAAIDKGRVVGMGRAISDRASDAYIQDVTVEKAYRGRGIGSKIIETLTGRLAADGLEWVALIAEKGSGPFYQGLGFAPMAGAVCMKQKEK